MLSSGWTQADEQLLKETVAAFGTNWDLVHQVLRAHPPSRSQMRSPRQCFEHHRKMVHATLPKDKILVLTRRNRSLGTYTGSAHRADLPGFPLPLQAIGHWRLRASYNVPVVPFDSQHGGITRDPLEWKPEQAPAALPALDNPPALASVQASVDKAMARKLRPPTRLVFSANEPIHDADPSHSAVLTQAGVAPIAVSPASVVTSKYTADTWYGYSKPVDAFRKSAPYVIQQLQAAKQQAARRGAGVAAAAAAVTAAVASAAPLASPATALRAPAPHAAAGGNTQ